MPQADHPLGHWPRSTRDERAATAGLTLVALYIRMRRLVLTAGAIGFALGFLANEGLRLFGWAL